ncbi:MAG: hypothetical protein ACFFCS_29155, partial [Candidatus Hodarchaeota archaeon]
YFKVLRQGLSPFDRFVSRGNIKDHVDVPNPRKAVDRKIMEMIDQTSKDRGTKFLPVVGDTGTGKTHAYWALKDLENSIEKPNWTIVYIPSPPAAIRIILHIYTCIISEIPDAIDIAARSLIERYDSEGDDMEAILEKAIAEHPGIFADCVKAFIIYWLDQDATRKNFARRWLLGEVLEEEELAEIGIHSVIDQDDVSLALIDIIAENLEIGESGQARRNKVLVLFFDEFESPYRMNGEEAERKFLDGLYKLFSTLKDTLIIGAVHSVMWPKILAITRTDFKSEMEPSVEIKPFTSDDMRSWMKKSQKFFWELQNLEPPGNLAFPLNEMVLNYIFKRAGGNPREIIKLVNIFSERVAHGELKVAEFGLEKSEQQGETVPSDVDALATQASEELDDIIDQEGLIYEVNPATISNAIMKGIQEISFIYRPEHDNPMIEFGFNFITAGRARTIGALMMLENERVAVDVPAIKTFDRGGGVAAYYCAKRLLDGINKGYYERAVVIMPVDTKGQKLDLLVESNPKLSIFTINQKQAEYIIESALNPGKNLSRELYKLMNLITSWNIEIPNDSISACDE